ncbi:unnamed protein product [Soboliphyme baturini]|uniref:Uncharacterized protein n=1 Tax=Soboliphyme baturini TaxID=241478 RepID=A0A183J2C0_9BILA|nr:unnamed protein product [Soboliphyme baturini]
MEVDELKMCDQESLRVGEATKDALVDEESSNTYLSDEQKTENKIEGKKEIRPTGAGGVPTTLVRGKLLHSLTKLELCMAAADEDEDQRWRWRPRGDGDGDVESSATKTTS